MTFPLCTFAKIITRIISSTYKYSTPSHLLSSPSDLPTVSIDKSHGLAQTSLTSSDPSHEVVGCNKLQTVARLARGAAATVACLPASFPSPFNYVTQSSRIPLCNRSRLQSHFLTTQSFVCFASEGTSIGRDRPPHFLSQSKVNIRTERAPVSVLPHAHCPQRPLLTPHAHCLL